MKTIEASQVKLDSAWYEGRTRLRVRIRDANTQDRMDVVVDMCDAASVLTGLLLELAQTGEHPAAQMMLEHLIDAHQKIERLSDT